MEDENATRQGDPDSTAFPPPRFVNLDAVQPTYANYVYVLQDQYAFHLIFGQISPPVIRTEEDRDAVFADGLAAEVVGRLIVTPSALRDIIAYMSEQLEIFETSRQELDLEREGGNDGV